MKQLLTSFLIVLFLNVVQLKPNKKIQILDTNLEERWGYTKVYRDVYLFWWLYMQNPPTKPLIIWLGLYSTAETNFNQYGPLSSDLEWRKNSLVHDYNILFIDSIAGAGFSFAEDEKLLTHSTHETTYDIFTCIKSFFIKFPEFKISPVIIIADSFFGKIAPELADLWHMIGSRENLQYNLKGLIIGYDPFFSLQTKIWENYEAIMNKLIDTNKEKINIVNDLKDLKNQDFWLDATRKIESVIDNYSPYFFNGSNSLITSITAFTEKVISTTDKFKLNNFMNDQVKKELKLTSTWTLYQSEIFIENVKNQIAKSNFKLLYEKLLNGTNLNIVFLNTPMDLKIHTKCNILEWIDHLNWNGKYMWNTQNEIVFNFTEKIEGFKKNYKNLYQYSITKNVNPDFTTNADFLRTVIAEVMKEK